VPRTIPDVEPRATAAQIRHARRAISAAARRHGLSALRLTADGTLLVHIDEDVTYRPVLQFVAEATGLLGAEPHVVTDDTVAAGRLDAHPL